MEPIAAGAPGSLAAEDCTPGYDRTTACQNGGGYAEVYRGGQTIGRATFTTNYKIILDIKQRVFAEKVAIHITSATGVGAGITAHFKGMCSSPCKADSQVPSGLMKPGTTIKGLVAYTDSTKTKHTGAITHQMSVTYPGATSTTLRAPFALKFRCDDLLKGQGAGCVWPDYTPTITTLSGLRFISANIRRWQGRGAPKLLHRNSYLTDKNRYEVCGKAKLPPGWKPPAGWPLPISDPDNKPTCDEYAFASSNEGGTRAGNGYDWVPHGENNSQGALLKNFYYANRVLNAKSARDVGDGFNVAV
ncbi:hypothetical protein GCM10023195_77570 [Actinoallomurus liliacearum]|uniref:Deoxyribonuclease NucA/NucB domain-containing protein n=1 Tax=Actinoallomurus liliacearum TaxID=1080073 RepID=A0ABP8TYB8_9ACTN